MMSPARLLAVVEVAKDKRIRCQAEGCGHSVYKRIHIVRIAGRCMALGSECYQKLYGGGAETEPYYGGGIGKLLTDEEREMLIENTRMLIEKFEREYQKANLAPPLPAVEAPPPFSMSRHSAETIVRQEMRAEGINPDLAGWRGYFEMRVNKLMRQPTNRSAL